MHCSREGHDRVEMELLERDRSSGTITYRCPTCGWVQKQIGRPSAAIDLERKKSRFSLESTEKRDSAKRFAPVVEESKKLLSLAASATDTDWSRKWSNAAHALQKKPTSAAAVFFTTLLVVFAVFAVLAAFSARMPASYGDGDGRDESRRNFLRGTGTAQDLARAAASLEQGCEEGHSDACDDLGWVYNELGGKYLNASGVAEDLVRAASYFEKSCDRGYSRACGELGYMYFSGEGVAADYARAADYYQKSCDGGQAFACAELGRMYTHGIGVSRDPDRAAAFYKAACSVSPRSSSYCR